MFVSLFSGCLVYWLSDLQVVSFQRLSPPRIAVVLGPACAEHIDRNHEIMSRTFLRKIDHVAGGVVGDDKVFSDAADSRRQRAARFLGFTSNACPKSSTFLGGPGEVGGEGKCRSVEVVMCI